MTRYRDEGVWRCDDTTAVCLSRAMATGQAAVVNRGRRGLRGGRDAEAYRCDGCGWWHTSTP